MTLLAGLLARLSGGLMPYAMAGAVSASGGIWLGTQLERAAMADDVADLRERVQVLTDEKLVAATTALDTVAQLAANANAERAALETQLADAGGALDRFTQIVRQNAQANDGRCGVSADDVDAGRVLDSSLFPEQ